MYALLLGLLFVFPGRPPADRCDELYASADRAYAALDYEHPAAVRLFVARSREARACYGHVASEQVRQLYYRELYALHRLGDYGQALAGYDELLARFAQRPDSSRLWWIYSMRGNARYYRGELNQAAGDYAQALACPTPSMQQRAKLLLDFANVLQRLRDFPGAREAYLQADQILRSAASSDAQGTSLRIRSLNDRADLLLEQTDLSGPAATESLRQAVGLLEESLALLQGRPPNTDRAQALVVLGEIYADLDEPQKAHDALQRALNEAQETHDAHWQYYTRYKLGRFYIKTEALDRAEAVLLDALARVDAARHRDYRRRILSDLGLLYERRRDFSRAERFYTQAIDVTEQYRESLRATEWSTTAFSEWQPPYRGLIRLLLAQARYEEAFLTLEQTRARHLQDMRMQSRLLGGLSPGDRTRFDSLTTALSETLSALAADTIGVAQRNLLRSQLARLTAARGDLIDLGRAFYAPAVEALQQVLAARGQIVLSYFIDDGDFAAGPPQRDPLSYAFVLTPDTLAAFPLHRYARDLEDLLAQVSPVLTAGQATADFNSVHFSLGALKRLYDVLYAPVASVVARDARLVIIPDGPLFMVPFGMLVEAETEPYAYQTAPYLVRRHPVSVQLATSLLLDEPAAAPDAPYDLVAFGKTRFSDVRQPGMPASGLIDLPAVALEIDAVRGRFRTVAARLDEQATEAAFMDLAPRARILHLASHTLTGSSSPLNNAVLLSPDPADDRFDGILYLHEIQRQHQAARLVVLSGCSTARGVLHPGEGMAGLQYAFQAMGVQSSLATSWLVEDAASVALMDAFYNHLRRGLPKDLALQRAQLAFLGEAGRTTASPFFWAAPVLYGDAAPLSLEGPRPAWTLLILPVAALLALLLGLRLARSRTSGRRGVLTFRK